MPSKATWKLIGLILVVVVLFAVGREMLARRGKDPIARIGEATSPRAEAA